MNSAPRVLVTGASRGIGLALTRALLARGAQVSALARSAPPPEVLDSAACSFISGDLRTRRGWAEAVDALVAGPRFDVVIHNAGIWPATRTLTEDGFEEAFAINHLAPVALTCGLVERGCAPERIVQISAGLYAKGRLDLARTPTGADFHGLRTYASTKAANVAASRALAAELEGRTTVNLVHPGVIRTSLGARGGLLGALLRLVKRRWRAPEDAVAAPLWLALSDEAAKISDAYFDELRRIEFAAPADDLERCRDILAHARASIAMLGTP